MPRIDLENIFKPFHINSDSHVVVCVSGGIDSMFMGYLTTLYQKKTGFKMTVLHFNYQLRSTQSDEDQNFVEKYFKNVLVVQSPIRQKTGIQKKAREIRLNYLEKNYQKKGWTHVVLGHHADDQAETVLMRIKRGAGLKGLGGIRMQYEIYPHLFLIRPLLLTTRNEIADYVKKMKIPYREDSSNSQTYYFRNQIRHGLLKNLKKNQKDIVSQISKSAHFLQKEYEDVLNKATLFLDKFNQEIPIQDYAQQNYSVRFEIVKLLLKKADFLKEVDQKHFDEIEHLLKKKKSLEKNWGKAKLVSNNGQFSFSGFNKKYDRCLYVDAQKIQGTLKARFVKKGDRFIALGMKGSKKLQDYFVDQKIPKNKRLSTIVLEDNLGIVSVVGHQIADRVKIDFQTSEIFTIMPVNF